MDGSRIEDGIEFDAAGRRVAYYFLKYGDGRAFGSVESIRVTAVDVLHCFKPMFAGQQLGLSWLSASATNLAEIDRLEDALLAKANSAALFGMVLTKPDEQGGLSSSPTGDYSMEPGATIIAPPGWEVTAVQPPNNEGSTEFLRSQVRSASAGAGVPYELVSGDLSQTNYSSARVGLLEFRRRLTAIQKNLLVARILDPLWKRAVLLEVLNGRLQPQIAAKAKAVFTFAGFEPIDPLKETNADLAAINGNIKSRAEVIAARGRDPHEVEREIRQDGLKPVKEQAA